MQLKDNKSKEHHFLVMRSVFTTAQHITVSYDLKGSVAGRITAEKGTVLVVTRTPLTRVTAQIASLVPP